MLAGGLLIRSNSATWDPLAATSVTLSNNNLTMAYTSGTGSVAATRKLTENKVYFEITSTVIDSGGHGSIGLTQSNLTTGIVLDLPGDFIYLNGVNTNKSVDAGFNQLTSLRTWGVAADFVNKTIWFRTAAGFTNNSNWNNDGTASPTTNTGGIDISSITGAPLYAAITAVSFKPLTLVLNAGASAFALAAPSGFIAYEKA